MEPELGTTFAAAHSRFRGKKKNESFLHVRPNTGATVGKCGWSSTQDSALTLTKWGARYPQSKEAPKGSKYELHTRGYSRAGTRVPYAEPPGLPTSSVGEQPSPNPQLPTARNPS